MYACYQTGYYDHLSITAIFKSPNGGLNWQVRAYFNIFQSYPCHYSISLHLYCSYHPIYKSGLALILAFIFSNW